MFLQVFQNELGRLSTQLRKRSKYRKHMLLSKNDRLLWQQDGSEYLLQASAREPKTYFLQDPMPNIHQKLKLHMPMRPPSIFPNLKYPLKKLPRGGLGLTISCNFFPIGLPMQMRRV